MREPHRPLFGFLWPRPDPQAPVDEAYMQQRLVRVTPRGPWRLGALLIGSVLLVGLTGSAVVAALAAPLHLGSFVGAAVAATALVLVLRGWVVGTYVSDAGVTIETTWRRIRIPWSEVVSAAPETAPCPILGLPFPVRGMRSLVRTSDGRMIATHVYRTSPDLYGRPEAFDIATERLENWARQV